MNRFIERDIIHGKHKCDNNLVKRLGRTKRRRELLAFANARITGGLRVCYPLG